MRRKIQTLVFMILLLVESLAKADLFSKRGYLSKKCYQEPAMLETQKNISTLRLFPYTSAELFVTVSTKAKMKKDDFGLFTFKVLPRTTTKIEILKFKSIPLKDWESELALSLRTQPQEVSCP